MDGFRRTVRRRRRHSDSPRALAAARLSACLRASALENFERLLVCVYIYPFSTRSFAFVGLCRVSVFVRIYAVGVQVSISVLVFRTLKSAACPFAVIGESLASGPRP